MFHTARPSLQSYALAILAVGLALALTLLLRQWMLGYSLFFLAAVMVSAWYGGLRAGLLATVLAAFSLFYFFIEPAYSLLPQEFNSVAWAILFVGVASLISSLNESRRRAEEKLKAVNQGLEKQVAERTAQLTQANRELEAEISERKKAAEQREKLIQDLQEALTKIKVLNGLLPICVECKNIQDGKGHWKPFEDYISEYSEATFSRSVCPECARKVYPNYPFLDKSP
ncbi:MAG TPA: DUF4118 domain-containing protein [Blastocatellia bacterium]|nr:DUF4118 domain-containing protein [Blastocatellia bacterium]